MRVEVDVGARLALVPAQWRARVERGHKRRAEAFKRSKAGGYVLADRLRAAMDADAWLYETTGIFQRVRVPLDVSDADIVQRAEECAAQALAMAEIVPGVFVSSIAELRSRLAGFVQTFGAVPPGEKIEDGPAVSRMTCAQWWRRALRTSQARALEHGGIALGFVHHRGEVYATNAAVERRGQQRRRNAEALEAAEAVNMDTGDIFTLAKLAEASVSNPRIRRGELMTRISGFEAVARGLGHACEFTTITCPSRFHAMKKTEDGGVARNSKFDGSTPRDAQSYLCRVWARIRAALARAGVAVYGFRIAEPHHDGCPHWHLLTFMPAASVKAWRETVRRYALAESPEEAGAQKRRCTFLAIDPDKGTAAGYVAKYVAKNIDGGGYQVQGDIETGKGAIYPGHRVDAWASTWGIRQFQQIGGPAVGVWRELRRMVAGEEKPDALNAAIAAADCGRNGKDENGTAGNWRRFVEVMGGPVTPRKLQRFGVARTRAGERWDRVNQAPYPAPPTRYGEAAEPVPFGVVEKASGRAWESFRYRWLIQRGKHGGHGGKVGDSGFSGVAGNASEASRAGNDGAGAAVLRAASAGSNAGFLGPEAPRTRVNNCTGGMEDDGRKGEARGGAGEKGSGAPASTQRGQAGNRGDRGGAGSAGA